MCIYNDNLIFQFDFILMYEKYLLKGHLQKKLSESGPFSTLDEILEIYGDDFPVPMVSF